MSTNTNSDAAPEVAQQEPVAFCELNLSGKGVAFFDGKPMLSTVRNDCHPHALYLGPAPRQEPAAPKLDYRGALADLVAEFKRVFPIYYYAEPWAHDSNAVLLNSQLLLSAAPQDGSKAPTDQQLTDAYAEGRKDQREEDAASLKEPGVALLALINAYGRACRRDGSPAWESLEGQRLAAHLAGINSPDEGRCENWRNGSCGIGACRGCPPADPAATGAA